MLVSKSNPGALGLSPLFQCLMVAICCGGQLLLPNQARADDDGNYCSARGYLAFDLRAAVTPGVKYPHVLRVIRFGSAQGISPTEDLPIEDFQTHQMYCTAGQVFISGWDRTYQYYLVDVHEPGSLRILKHVNDPLREFSYSGHKDAPTLGYASRPGTIPLQSDDPNHFYELVMTRSEKRVKEGLVNHWRSELVQTHRDGRVLRRVLLASGSFLVSAD